MNEFLGKPVWWTKDHPLFPGTFEEIVGLTAEEATRSVDHEVVALLVYQDVHFITLDEAGKFWTCVCNDDYYGPSLEDAEKFLADYVKAEYEATHTARYEEIVEEMIGALKS